MFANSAEGSASSINYTGVFYDALAQAKAPAWFKLVFWILPSTMRTEVVGFMKGLPGMRRWVGERRIKNLAAYAVSVSYERWESTVAVQNEDVMDDRFYIIVPQIQALPKMYIQHIYDYFTKMLPAGFTANCYDGQPFFDTSHPNGANGVFRNSTDQALSASEWALARRRSAVIVAADDVEDGGKPRSLNINFNWLFYAPQAESSVLTTFGQQYQGGGANNIYYNAIVPEQRIRVDEWGDSQQWYLFDLSKTDLAPAFRPLLLQIRQGLNFVPFDKPTDWTVFSKAELVYGQDCYDNAQYLMPEFAYGSNVA